MRTLWLVCVLWGMCALCECVYIPIENLVTHIHTRKHMQEEKKKVEEEKKKSEDARRKKEEELKMEREKAEEEKR